MSDVPRRPRATGLDARGAERLDGPGAIATVFKSFSGAIAAVFAAMPVVATTFLGVLPTYAEVSATLPFFTSLLCLLAIALAIAHRRDIARMLFVRLASPRGTTPGELRPAAGLLPVGVAALSVLAVGVYLAELDRSKDIVRAELLSRRVDTCLMAASALESATADDERLNRARDYLACVADGWPRPPRVAEAEILTTKNRIPFVFPLILSYAAIFTAAQLTLVILAVREHYLAG